MSWTDEAVEKLCGLKSWEYVHGGPSFSEPTALAAQAMVAYGRVDEADLACRWLIDRQSRHGRIGIEADESTPGWATGHAVLAWLARREAVADGTQPFDHPIGLACAWILSIAGRTLPPSPTYGHDTTLVGWPWVVGTHSWVAPTATNVLALKAAGYADHPRVREAVRLLFNRLLPDGGANYGNTTVLGHQLRPHLEPTGWALMALAGESPPDDRLRQTVEYARRAATHCHTPWSLSCALMGLAAHGQTLADADGRLRRAFEHAVAAGSACKMALVLLAARGTDGPLIQLPRGSRESVS